MEDPYIKKEYDERLVREGVENGMRPEYYDKNYKVNCRRSEWGASGRTNHLLVLQRRGNALANEKAP
jgi:hypothetical protein